MLSSDRVTRKFKQLRIMTNLIIDSIMVIFWIYMLAYHYKKNNKGSLIFASIILTLQTLFLILDIVTLNK